jgi:hypothetical protein
LLPKSAHQSAARRSKRQALLKADPTANQTPRDDNFPLRGNGKLIIENGKCRVLKTVRSAALAAQISAIKQ